MEIRPSPSAQNLSQHGLSSTGNQPGFSRRYACDRCRGHKLRCNRDGLSLVSTPCRRCSKANAKCTISPNFRPGKPAGGGEAVRQERAVRAQATIPETREYPSPSTRSPLQEFGDTSKNGEGENRGLDQSDSLELFTTPWMDAMEMSFGGQELQFSEGTAEAFSGSRSILNTPYISNPDCSSNTALPGYRPQSPTNNHGFNQSTTGADEYASTALHDIESREQSPPKGARIPINVSNGGLEALGNYMLSGSNGALPLITSPSSPNAALQSHSASQNNSNLSCTPADQKEACIQKLSELSASLMKDLSRLNTCKLATSFLFTQSDRNTASYLFKTADRTMIQNNAVGKMLHSTEKFLEILQDLKLPLLAQRPPSPPVIMDGSDGGGLSGIDNVTGHMSDGSKEGLMETRWNVLQSYFDRPKAPTLTPHPPASETTSFHSSGQSIKLDVPSTLVILNCYTCLLKIFETAFHAIYYSLECAPFSALDAKLPPTVPGLQINGFVLNDDRSLQIKILIQISKHMLDSLETALWSGDENNSGGILGDPVFQALLQTLLKQEGLDYAGENKSGMRKIRDMLKKVETSLK